MTTKDDITSRFFDHRRWVKAIDGGVEKGIGKALLRTLARPEVRIALYCAIAEGRYDISPPHAALIPKDTPGEYRTVYVNEPADRIILSIANDLLFELTPELIHPSCKSYLSGMGCGKIVTQVSRYIAKSHDHNEIIGWKSDLSKYFDSVGIEHIDRAFHIVEQRYGKSALIDMLCRYYHNDEYINHNGEIAHKYMSLRQGCAVSAWLADVLLHHIDERLSALNGYYVRYSDDMLFVGPDHEKAMTVLSAELDRMSLSLNPKKVEQLKRDKWFCFLGFSLKGNMISLSRNRLSKFGKTVNCLTMNAGNMRQATARINRFFYKGYGDYSWSSQVLPVINCDADLRTLNTYVMDAIRAAATGKHRIGGLGYTGNGACGCIARGKGRHVGSNRLKTPKVIDNYMSLSCMRNAMKTSREAYEAIVRQM